MTKAEANKVLRWFQKQGGLVGWKIDIHITNDPPPELGGDIYPSSREHWFGRYSGDAAYRSCSIWVNPIGHKEDNEKDGDMTETLIHELIHGLFMECGVEASGDHAEWAVNWLAAILTKQYRLDNA